MVDTILNVTDDTTDVDTTPPAVKEATNTKASEDFLSTLPESLRDVPVLKSVKGVEDLATQFVNQQSLIGNSLRIPSEDASDEARNEFYNKITSVPGVIKMPGETADEAQLNEFYTKLGVPEKPDGYKVNVPEGKVIDQEYLSQATEWAHEMKLTNTQLNQVVNKELAAREAVEVAQAQYVEGAQAELKKIWSTDYENRVAGATNAFRIYSKEMPEYAEELQQFANNPIFIKLLSDAAKGLTESGHIGMQQANNYGLSVEEARMKRDEIMANPSHGYFNGEQSAVDYMLTLNQIIAGASE